MNEPVTIKHIARQLNVSVSTVSRALKDHPRIGPETKARVLALARELGYQPNVLSLNLLNNRSNSIGIIVPKISYNFYSQAISGIEEVVIAAGYNNMICQSNERYEREVANAAYLASHRVTGLIVSLAGSTQSYEHFTGLLNQGLPLVFFDRVCDELATSRVIVDNQRAAYTAVTHLIEEGCRRIALLAGPPSLYISNQRKQGYLDALRMHAIPLCEEIIGHSDFTEAGAARLTQQLLDLAEPPDAIFAVSDRLAISTMTVLKSRGIRIPGEVALVGFGNDSILSLVSPTLSSVDQDPFEIGKVSAELLLRQVTTGAAPEVRVIATRLIVRESSRKR
jgi:DNA-binding LacI/PurR family transcriptional regulator